MILEFVNITLIVLLICLEIFAISLVIRSFERRRSTVMPGFIRDFDGTPSQKRKIMDKNTIQYLSITSMVGGAIIMGVSFGLSQLLFVTGIILVLFSAICQILVLKDSKKRIINH